MIYLKIIRRKCMKHNNWRCVKCNHHGYTTGRMAATGGGLSKFFNIQNKKFSTVTCSQCKFTELYQASTSALANIFDYLGG